MGKMTRAIFARLNYWTGAALLLVFFVLIYLITGRHNQRLDLTKDKIFTLSQQTVETLRQLDSDEPVMVKAFFKENQPGKEELEDLLKAYTHVTTHLKYQFFDPDRYPGQSKLYGIDAYGTVIVEKKDRRERFDEISEESLTNTLLRLNQAKRKTVYFIQGHGEKDLDLTAEKGYFHLRTKLQNENYTVNFLNLAREGIPADADAVIIAGPEKDYYEKEITDLKDYLEKGGRLLLLLDPAEEPLVNLAAWLKSYGIILGRDVIVDKLSRLFGADALIPVVTTYAQHAITKGFNLACFLPYASSVTVSDEFPQGYQASELVFTSQGSWAEKNWEQLGKGEVSFDEGDTQGPISLAAVLEKEASDLRMVVVGDSDLADNTHFYLSGNKDFTLNLFAWLVGEEKLLAIRSKGRDPTPLVLTEAQQRIIFVVPIFIMPAAVFIVGLAVLFYRRKYR